MKFANRRIAYQIFSFLILVLFSLPAMAAENTPAGGKVAVVNGVVITRDHYDKELKVHLEQVSRRGRQISEDQIAKLKENVLDDLIGREVLYQESQKLGIKVSDQTINDQITDIKRRLETVKASHILIKVEPTADDAAKAGARKKIEDVRKKLTAGGDFAELAKEYSEGPSGPSGGDLGYIKRGQMVKPFEEAAFSLKPNEISGVVETRFGYHLIKVYDKKSEYNETLKRMNITEEEVRSQIERGKANNELIEQQVASKVVITEEESKTFYENNPQFFKQPEMIKVSQILVRVEVNTSEVEKAAAMKKIKEIEQKLKDGSDFADLIKKYSEESGTIQGGDLGYIRRGQMPNMKAFEDAAFAMAPNEISDIVETSYGYHLIKVYDKKPEQLIAYEVVKDQLMDRLKKDKERKAISQYVEKLKKNAKIEKML